MFTAASMGGLQVVCPESSSSEDCARLMIPPVQVCNSFSENVEFARLAAAVRLSSRIRGVEQDLITFDLAIEMTRQLSLANSSSDAPVMDLILNRKKKKSILSSDFYLAGDGPNSQTYSVS